MNDLTEQTLVERLRTRAQIRRSITTRKSVQNGEPDRIAELLEEAAMFIEDQQSEIAGFVCDNKYLQTELRSLKCLYDCAQTKLNMAER